MSALKMEATLSGIERTMGSIAPHRQSALFERFLIEGYSAVTLDSVAEIHFSDLLRAKLCLGTLITLYDDFADRPIQADASLLENLYQRRFGGAALVSSTKPTQRVVVDFANSLFVEIEGVLKSLPNFDRFFDVLNFDLLQFYSANQYASLVTANPALNNRLENRLYAHHNMGMVLVGTMDLMASENVVFSELGEMREVFLLGQRMGRIFNVLATRDREVLDGDVTGELSACHGERELEIGKRRLRREILALRRELTMFDSRVTTFSVRSYLQGLMNVQQLHEQMEGVL